MFCCVVENLCHNCAGEIRKKLPRTILTENHHVESSLVVIKIVCKQIYYKISIWKNKLEMKQKNKIRDETFFSHRDKKKPNIC